MPGGSATQTVSSFELPVRSKKERALIWVDKLQAQHVVVSLAGSQKLSDNFLLEINAERSWARELTCRRDRRTP